jgi:Na+-driven multidrug efflux pump
MLLFLLFSSPIISIFTSDPKFIGMGSGFTDHRLRLYFYGIGMVMIQALNSAGYQNTYWINFIGFCYQLPGIPAGKYIWGDRLVHLLLSLQLETAIAAYYYFKKGKWKEVKV